MAVATVEDNWQATVSHVLARTTHMFNNPDMSDVSFIFNKTKGQPVKIYGHKFVLGMSSSIFYKMFYNKQFSTSMENNNEIRMTEEDYSFDSIAFFNFIKFLYTDNITWAELSVKNIIGILQCSDYYDVPRLRAESGKVLISNLSADNAILLLETGLLYKDNDLEEKSLEFIDKSALTLLQSDAILEAKTDNLFRIIKRDTLTMEESKVLDVCLKWSVKECARQGLTLTHTNQREVLGQIFFEIRFPILPALKIAELVASNFLTQKESLDMLLYMHCTPHVGNAENTSFIPETPFKTQKRLTSLNKCAPCSVVYPGMGQGGHAPPLDSLDF